MVARRSLKAKKDGHPDGNQFKIVISSGANYKRRRRTRRALFEVSPNCHWCGIPTREVTEQGSRPDDEATLDHLVSRHHRSRNPQYTCEVVLACRKCNQDRNNREIAAMDIEERWERCGTYPKFVE